MTALHYSAIHGHNNVAALLLERGTSIDSKDKVCRDEDVNWINFAHKTWF
jgi:ankyrin repeat protein